MTRNFFRFFASLSLALAFFGMVSNVSAGGGTNNGHFRDLGGNAYFYSTDPSGCVVTEVIIFATQHYFQSPPGRGDEGPFASLLIFQYDVCTGTELISASGSAGPDLDIQVDKKLNWATMTGTALVFDGVSQSDLEIFMDMAWTAVGPPIHETSNSHFQSPKCHLMARSNGIFRSAEASGTLSDGVTNFTPDSALVANIFKTKSGNLTVGCNE
jgi:hypothetical protein